VAIYDDDMQELSMQVCPEKQSSFLAQSGMMVQREPKRYLPVRAIAQNAQMQIMINHNFFIKFPFFKYMSTPMML
jgi:hypothetical protein